MKGVDQLDLLNAAARARPLAQLPPTGPLAVDLVALP